MRTPRKSSWPALQAVAVGAVAVVTALCWGLLLHRGWSLWQHLAVALDMGTVQFVAWYVVASLLRPTPREEAAGDDRP